VGRLAKLALIAAAASAWGCLHEPTQPFRRVDFAAGSPPPPSTILVGKNVVVRLESGSGPRGWDVVTMRVDVLPPGAVLRGATVRTVRRGRADQGAAMMHLMAGTQRYWVWWRSSLAFARTPSLAVPDTTTVWLGPVCLNDACETFVVKDGDWPGGR
jgi:hypothetical protein